MNGFFVLGFFLIVVVIPIILGVGSDIYKRKLKLQEKQLELQSTMTAEKAAQYAAHTERLEQRMRVLERIITDKGTDLAIEIEDLRDKQIN
jgi:uncharacterized membrane protein (DUF106 family)